MAELGTPKGQLNVKPYYPVYIEFKGGIILKDSLILAQRKLEKWAEDLDVEHKKASGTWDYDRIMHQSTKLTEQDLTYAEYDTLAGVECIDATMQTLKAKIYTIPYTNTGIVRAETRKRGKKNRARQYYLKNVPDWEGQQISEMLYHGGYTHSCRHAIGWVYPAEAQDFASRYPADLLLNMYPGHKFAKYEKPITKEKLIEEILILTGESRGMSNVEYIGEACKLARKYFRMVGLEIYPVNTDEYRYLHECGADYVTVFQETYQEKTYE